MSEELETATYVINLSSFTVEAKDYQDAIKQACKKMKESIILIESVEPL